MIEGLVRKLELYGPVSADERQALERGLVQVLEYGAHQDIVHEGDCPTTSCLVVEGFACRFRVLVDGKRQILALHIPGDFCDLHSFVLKRMDHGIASITPCKVAHIAHGAILAITDEHPRLARALWWDMAIDGAIMREWMVSMGRRTSYQQVGHMLCEMLLRLRVVGMVEDDGYELPVTQAELGDMFGLSTVHVNRVLQTLRADGLIVWRGKWVTIPDLQALMSAVEFDPSYLHVRGGFATAKA